MSDSGPNDLGYKQELKRELGMASILFYGMAMLLPIAPVPVYGAITLASEGHMSISYLVAVGPILFTAWSFGQMVGAFPYAGATFTYVSKGWNENLGFMTGWLHLFSFILFLALNYICLSLYVRALFPFIPFWLLIVGAVIIITFINLTGIKDLSMTNNILTIFGFVVVAYFIFMAVMFLSSGQGTGFTSVAFINPEKFNLNVLYAGSSLAILSFLGFEAMTTLAEEVHEPRKTMPKAILIVCFFMALVFATMAFFAQACFPDITRFTDPNAAFIDVAMMVGGQTLVTVISLAMVAGCIAFGLDVQAGVARLLYGMGRDGVLPRKFFTYLHPKTKVPVYSTIAIGLICISLSWIELNEFFPTVCMTGLIVNSFVNIAVICHFYIRGKKRGVGGFIKYLLLPGAGFVTCAFLCFGLGVQAALVTAVWIGLGIIYLAYKTKFFRQSISAPKNS